MVTHKFGDHVRLYLTFGFQERVLLLRTTDSPCTTDSLPHSTSIVVHFWVALAVSKAYHCDFISLMKQYFSDFMALLLIEHMFYALISPRSIIYQLTVQNGRM